MSANKIQKIVPSRHIYVVGGVRGRLQNLQKLHYFLGRNATTADTIIYTGDSFVHGHGTEIISEICAFRCWFLAKRPFVHPHRLLFLQGLSEEIFTKFFTLHLADKPVEVIKFAIEYGLEQAFVDFGVGLHQLLQECQKIDSESPNLRHLLAQWTRALRHSCNQLGGLLDYFEACHHAAYYQKNYLLVNAGLDPAKPLMLQGDNFWLGGKNIANMLGYNGFQTIVRGQDHWGNGLINHPQFVSLYDPDYLACAVLTVNKPVTIEFF